MNRLSESQKKQAIEMMILALSHMYEASHLMAIIMHNTGTGDGEAVHAMFQAANNVRTAKQHFQSLLNRDLANWHGNAYIELTEIFAAQAAEAVHA